MKLIAISRLRQDANRYPGVKKQVENWYKVVKNAKWNNLEEVKKIYKTAEAVGNFTVFNLKGNNYRLIVGIDYESQVIYYKYFLTHSEYDKNNWKNDPYF
ncbi:MAG: type II toxin-antitoxin system HigB family toxin [Crocosphaera sp.]|uniref:type II toxin-antitoxin system HigB family toxin n=1 Tax=Crocosphaera sp. TaxID=2729996 RepID=UPI002612946E|nr:type II toxin-antitoxin system HigB family toxin [Crocosphaera sp.]MDJ0578971.1 type II toxin-antitoxin system HigB family toxin [Crocosphaera sp.]